MNTSRVRRWSRTDRQLAKTSRRGAAMVEGIIVLGTMMVFLGTTKFAHDAYAGKLDQMTAVRRDTMYYATHNCDDKQKLAASTVDKQEDVSDQEPTATGADTLKATDTGVDQAVSRSWNNTSSTKETYVSGDAIWWGANGVSKFRNTPTRLTTGSWVMCNEKRYDNTWTAVFKFGWSFLKTGGGIKGPGP